MTPEDFKKLNARSDYRRTGLIRWYSVLVKVVRPLLFPLSMCYDIQTK